MRKHQRRFAHREENYVAKSQAQLASLKHIGAMTFYIIFTLCAVGFWYYHRRSKVLAGVTSECNIGHTYTLLETNDGHSTVGGGEDEKIYDSSGFEISNIGHSDSDSGTSASKMEFDLRNSKEMRSKFKYLT